MPPPDTPGIPLPAPAVALPQRNNSSVQAAPVVTSIPVHATSVAGGGATRSLEQFLQPPTQAQPQQAQTILPPAQPPPQPPALPATAVVAATSTSTFAPAAAATTSDDNERSLAGFLTAAAAHVESSGPKKEI